MKKRIFMFTRLVFPLVFILAVISGALTGVQAAPYFKGKAIVFVVPLAPGGGTDIWGRFTVRHLKEHIPGNPRIVIRNMPGAGSVIGANFVWASKPTGKTGLVSSGSVVQENVLRSAGTDFMLDQMNPLYASPIGTVTYVKKGFIKEPKDIMTVKGIIIGHISPVGGNGSSLVWSKELLGFKPDKMIWGYSGGSAARRAFLQGELNCTSESTIGYNSAVKPYVKKGEVVPIFQSGILDDDGNVVREKAAPDVPTVPELYEQIHGKKPSGPVFEAYKLMVGGRVYGKALVLPKNTPADIVKIYEKAVAKMVKDPKFLKEINKLNPGAPHLFGKALKRNYPAGVSGPKEVVQYMKEILSKKYKIKF